MTGIYLLLGTNLGNRFANLQRAKEILTSHVIIVKRESKIYETAAWGVSEQPSFLNQVIEVDTGKSPERTLKICQMIEDQMGRIRTEKWGARLIDIDILYFNSHEYSTEQLTIPHPEIPNRRFTLIPMAELAPNMIHPSLNKTQEELLVACQDSLEVHLYDVE